MVLIPTHMHNEKEKKIKWYLWEKGMEKISGKIQNPNITSKIWFLPHEIIVITILYSNMLAFICCLKI